MPHIIFLFLFFIHGAHAQTYAVATAHPLATQAGLRIMQEGGNAFDAAVAISAALAVVEPHGSGLGGGGFWLLHDAKTNQDIVIDGRERAPLKATKNMYLDAQGEATRDSVNGPLAAGIPGVVAALDYLSEQYGQLGLAQNLQPAIEYARQGFKTSERHHRLIKMREKVLLQSPAAKKIFIDQAAEVLIQSDLADSLTLIARHGAEVFYQGELAQRLVAGVKDAGGIWQLEDLASYRLERRSPIKTQYKNLSLILPPPPTSGGVVLSQMLAMLEAVELTQLSAVERIHVITEAMRRAYQDRALYLGDPAYSDIPMQMLLDKNYARAKFASFDPQRASPSEQLAMTKLHEGQDTSHFSVLDTAGNFVAATLSINYPFGSGFVAPGTGILLNDEMDDFVIAPGVANVWGLVGSEVNSIAPGKRMLSSMTPLFAYDGDKVLIAGTPGGSRIISMLALALLDFQAGASSQEIVSGRRFHHQYLPDQLQFELHALSSAEKHILTQKGHTLKEIQRHYGNMQVIVWDRKQQTVSAASDPRGEGLARTSP